MQFKRELMLKDEGQEYAQVQRMLGNGRLEAYCFDGTKRLAIIRGKLQKKCWINQGDIILLSLRDFQDDKADVIYKYNPDEARALKARGELPDSTNLNEGDAGEGDNDDAIVFEDDEDEVEFAGAGAGGRNNNMGDMPESEDESDLDIDQI